MQCDRLQEIIKRLASREGGPWVQVHWQAMPSPSEVVTLTLGPDQAFRTWRWSNEWVPCGTITCSIRHWNCELIYGFYRAREGLNSRLVWMVDGEVPPEPWAAAADPVTCVGRPIAVKYEADLANALVFLLGKGPKPLWLEEAHAPATPAGMDSMEGVGGGHDPQVRRCVLVTSADERRGCQWCG
jgi:hypothetical protein